MTVVGTGEEVEWMIEQDHDAVGFLPKDLAFDPRGDTVRGIEDTSQPFERKHKLNFNLGPDDDIRLRGMEVGSLRRYVAGSGIERPLRSGRLVHHHPSRHVERKSFELPFVSHVSKAMHSGRGHYRKKVLFFSVFAGEPV